ncbi:MAG: flagellar basal body P-ring formation chaperone FlgA [Spirochaetia bacterium]|nr:flagellar basal body P-ring formation chaperone FlgA [Spirochaetia bacterium]
MIRALPVLILLWVAPAFGYQMYLEPVARVRAERVLLRDVARLEGGGPGDQVLLGKISEPYYLSREELQTTVKEKPEAIFGPGVWVVPLTKKLTSIEVLDQLKLAIRRLPGGDDFLSKHTLKVASELETSSGSAMVFRLPARASQLSAGRRIISADMIVPDNGKDRTLMRQQIDVEIAKRVRVPVAARDLRRGETIKAGDFRLVTRELTTDNERFASENPVGQRVLSDVEEGKTLHSSEVQHFPTVRRGQSLTLVHQTPGIVLKCRSTALQDGEPGGRIDVRIVLPSGQKSDIRKADVVDEKTAVLAR